MNVLIRKNCFETNSSSAHSVSVAGTDKDFILDTLYPNEQGIVEIELRDFGWDWFKTNDPETKAAYCWQQYEHSPDVQDTIYQVIQEQTGAEAVVFNRKGDESYDVYIDHQSMEGDFGGQVYDRDTIKDFIFNKNSWLFGGNDNETAEPSFYDVPVYKKTDKGVSVKKVVLTHEIVFKGFSGAERVASSHEPDEKEISKALQWALGQYDSFLSVGDDANETVFFSREDAQKFGYNSFNDKSDKHYEYDDFEYNVPDRAGTVRFHKSTAPWGERDKPENIRSFKFAVKAIKT